MNERELHAYAAEIARELGVPWRYDVRASRDAHGDLMCTAALRTDLSEYGVGVRVDWHKATHLRVSGSIPTKDRQGNRHYTHAGSAPSITVAIARGTRAAARAITGRLLPVYGPIYAKARGVVERENDALGELDRVEKMLAPFGRLMGGRRYSGASDGRFTLERIPDGGQARFSHWQGATRLQLDVTVSPETAVEVLALIQARETE